MVGHREPVGRAAAVGGLDVPRRAGPLPPGQQSLVRVQDDLVRRVLERAERGGLTRVGVAQHAQRVVGVGREDDGVEALVRPVARSRR